MPIFSLALLLLAVVARVYAGYDSASKSNIALYWGQNSNGLTGTTYQERLSHYCSDDNVDIILLSFLVTIDPPTLNFANQGSHCDITEQPFVCEQIEKDIQECQGNGKTILLSIGGWTSPENGFNTTEEAEKSAENIWKIFGPSSSSPSTETRRPFGDAAVDGFDFDFEGRTVPVSFMPDFGKKLRELMNQDASAYRYLTAAPQCPNSDNSVQNIIDEIQLDMVFVQFYNNPACDSSSSYNFEHWDGWAGTKQTKYFIGLPGGPEAMGKSASGYVKPNDLQASVINNVKDHSANLAGGMVWDASQSWNITDGGNKKYHDAFKEALCL